MLDLEIVNIVATADIRQGVDLSRVSNIKYTIYDQEIYGGRVAYLKSPDMSGKVTIFPSGKLISVGTKTLEQAQSDLDETVRMLVLEGLIKPIEITAEIRNIVAVLQVGNPIDLESLSVILDGIYEPEQFPGMIVRADSPKVTYLIFSSGKVVIAGSRSMNDLEKAAKIVKDRVRFNIE